MLGLCKKQENILKESTILADLKQVGTSSKSSVRTIYKVEIKYAEPRINIEITGNGFLYNMVRIIAGTLLDVGLRKN